MHPTTTDSSMANVEVTKFASRFAAALAVAYAQHGKSVQKSTGQSIEIPQSDLHSHTYDVVNRGHEKYKKEYADFKKYFEKLKVDHIKWAASVLENDGASVSAFMKAIQEKVAPAVVKKFDHQQFAITFADDLPSHLLIIGKKSGRPPIATYLGRSKLETWLTGIGIKRAINEQKRHGQAVGGEDSDTEFVDSQSPDNASDEMKQTEKLENLRRILYEQAKVVNQELSPKDSLVLQFAVVQRLKPAEIADCISVSRARVSQIRSSIARKVVARVTASPGSIIQEYELDADVVEEHFWDILGVTDLTESGGSEPRV